MVDIDLMSRNKLSYPKILTNGWQDFKRLAHPRLQWQHPIQVGKDKENQQNSCKKVRHFLKELQDASQVHKSECLTRLNNSQIVRHQQRKLKRS